MFSNILCVLLPPTPIQCCETNFKNIILFPQMASHYFSGNYIHNYSTLYRGRGRGMMTLILALSCKCFINFSPRLSEKWQKCNIYNYTFLLFPSDIFNTFFIVLNLKWTWLCMLRPISFFHKEIFVYCIFFNPSWHVFVLITYYFPLCYVLTCISFCC